MFDPDSRPAAPNFTNACIVMFGVNLTWVLVVVWALWGLIGVALAAWLINRVIARIETARHG